MSVSFSNSIKNNNENNFFKKFKNFSISIFGVPHKEKLFFVQYLGVMLKSGISLSSALKTLAEQSENKFFKIILTNLSENVDKGRSFSESLKDYNEIFGELFINMIEAGEISGKLESVLDQLYIQMKKQQELLSKVKGAIIYPSVILIAIFCIATFMLIFVVPTMTAILKEASVALPLPTKILIFISDSLSKHALISIVIIILFFGITYRILKTKFGKYYFQSLLLKLPVISIIIKKINLASFSRTISSLLKTDIMIVKSFQVTASVLSNLHYRKALIEMSEIIKKGGSIAEVLKLYPNLFPPVVYQMISVGEQTGELDKILYELAEFYESEVENTMSNIPSIIEPILTLVLGIGVAGLALAILMPMYSLSSSIN